MVSLPTVRPGEPDDSKKSGGACGPGGGCGTSCGSGLEKVYPTTAVRFGAMRWIGEFQYRPGTVFKCGAKVIIETDRGTELGEQVSLTCNGCDKSVSREQIRRYVETSGPEFYELKAGRILREATPQDIADQEHLNAPIQEDIDRAALLAMQTGLDLKIVTVEHLFGGERIVFYFRSEERIDFRTLVRELAAHYRTRIEMRQVGARDEARLVADYEVCGRECCCKNFLKKLRPVNMRMAKLQKSTLDPSKVSGRCGRLRCCLRYEHEAYESLNAKLPRTGARVNTKMGPATVIDRQILTQLLLVKTDEGQDVAVPIEDLLDIDLAPTAFTRLDEADGDHDHEHGHGPRGGDGPSGGSRGRDERRDGDRRPRPDGPRAERPQGDRPARDGGQRRDERGERPPREQRGGPPPRRDAGPRGQQAAPGRQDERSARDQAPRPGGEVPSDRGAQDQIPDAENPRAAQPARESPAARGTFQPDGDASQNLAGMNDSVPPGAAEGGGPNTEASSESAPEHGGGNHRSRRRRRRRRGGGPSAGGGPGPTGSP